MRHCFLFGPYFMPFFKWPDVYFGLCHVIISSKSPWRSVVSNIHTNYIFDFKFLKELFSVNLSKIYYLIEVEILNVNNCVCARMMTRSLEDIRLKRITIRFFIKTWLWYNVVIIPRKAMNRDIEAGCKICGHSLESIPHCFWNCVEAISIWGRCLRILVACCVNERVVWGSLHGLKVTGEGWAEQLNPHGHGFIV